MRLRALALLALAAAGVTSGQAQRPADPDLIDARIRPLRGVAGNGPGGAAPGAQPGERAAYSRSEYALRGRLSAPRAGDAEQVARSFLDSRAGLAGARTMGAIELPLAARFETAGSGVTHLHFEPRFAGIPFFDADVVVHVDSSGRVLRFEEKPRPAIPTGVAASMTPLEALRAAWESASSGEALAAVTAVSEAPPPGRESVYSSLSFADNATVGRVWFPLNDAAVAAWRIYLSPRNGSPRLMVVDDASGLPLFSLSLRRDTAPRGLVFRAGDRAHPGEGSQTLEALSGWPGSSGACPSDIYPSQYQSGALKDRCWVAGAETAGNNADACLDAVADNVCDYRAQDANAHFEFAFTNSYDLLNDPAPDRSAAITNAFYWNNVIHDWLYRLGFNEASGNFQADNFGRGGSGGDAVRVDVQDGGTASNANFSTPPDGIAPRMQLGLFSGLRRDSAFDGDVVVHEYAHGLTNRLVGGPQNSAALFIWHSGAMGEGWSDAYAASLTDHAVIGEYVTKNPTTGIRSVAYDNSPYTFGDFGVLRTQSVSGAGILRLPQVHRDGEIWASALWDLRTALGPAGYEQALTAGLKLTPSRPSMLDARDAILQAAETLGLGGASQCNAWSAFAARGFGASAALNPIQPGQPNDTGLSVFEAFDLPPICGGVPPVSGGVVFSDGAEDGSGGWTATGQWHRTTRRAAAGLYSWWFGQESSGEYHTGARVAGTLTSPPINLSGVGGAIVEWDQYLDGEGFGSQINISGIFGPYLNADSGRLRVSNDSGSSWVDVTHLAHDSPANTFTHYRVNLSDYAGQTVLLRFDFDTFDDIDNAHEGWFLDNITVSSFAGNPPRLLIDREALHFAAVAGGAAPANQTIAVSNGGGGSLLWTAHVTAGGAWLSVSPPSGSGSGVIEVSALPAGLVAGVYQGTIRISAVGALDSPIEVGVTFNLSEPSGPVAIWAFDEPAHGVGVTISDSSGNGRHGTTFGAGSLSIPGVVGKARLLNGSTDYVEFANSASLTPQKFTFRAWINVRAYPGNYGVIFAAYGGANVSGWFVAVNSSGKVVLMCAQPPSSAPWLVSNASLPLDSWRHISITVDRATGSGKIYLDGVLDRALTFPAPAADTTQPIRIGRASWYQGAALHFAIDEAELRVGAAGAAAVLADYQSFPPPPPASGPKLIAHWKMDETATAAGTSLADQTGNGHAALAQGGPSGSESGVDGRARKFGGHPAWARVAANAALNSPSFTFSTWVKLDALPGTWGVLYSNRESGFRGWFVGVSQDGRVILSVAGEPSSSPWLMSNSSLVAGRWHWLAVSFDSASRMAKIYIDGAFDRALVFPAFSPPSGVDPAFARASWSNSYYLAVSLDDARFYDAALAGAALSEIFGGYPHPPEPAARGPVASWKFDEPGSSPGTVLADSTGNGHGATAQGTGGTVTTGVSGNARLLGGYPDFASVASHGDFETQDFSFAAWVRLDAYPSSWGVLFSNYGGNYRGWFLGVFNDGRVILSVAGQPSSAPWLLSSGSLELGRWHRLVVTFNGASRLGSISIDGALDRALIFPAYTAPSGVNPMFGRASWTNGYYLAHRVDEARYWARHLTAAEVAADFSEFPEPPSLQSPAPSAQWNFEESATASGTILSDAMANGHDATISGAGTLSIAGVDGLARRFSGASGYAVTAPVADYGANDFSLSVWVRLSAYPGNFGILFSNFGGDFQGWFVAVNNVGRVILMVAGLPSSAPWITSNGALPLNQWTHLTVTFDGDSRRGAIYLNAGLDRVATNPAYSPQSSVAATFGKASWANSYYLAVDLDRARYFTRELTAVEVLLETAGSQ